MQADALIHHILTRCSSSASLEPLVALRNPAAHSKTVTCGGVVARREQVLGIGCEGRIVKLARARATG